jgi:hypothetical protein
MLFGRAIVSPSLVAAILVGLGACDPPDPPDPCAIAGAVDRGAAEIGLGAPFTALADGQELEVELGIQGLWMFVVNARVPELELATPGAVWFAAVDAAGAVRSLELGCRTRDFVAAAGGWELAAPYFLAFPPSFTPELDGAALTLRAEVIDRAGHRAVGEHRVVARLPPPPPDAVLTPP